MATKPKTKPKAEKSTNERVSPAFYVLRGLAIHFAARAEMPTADIAAALDVNRSYVIRQTTLSLKARTPHERRIAKLAAQFEGQITRAGFKGLLGNEDIDTTLAGGERPKLGPLAERKAAKSNTAKPKAAKPKAPAKKVAKVAKPKAAPTKVNGKPAKPVAAKPAPKAAKAPKPKALKALKAPKPETLKLAEQATAEDILGNGGADPAPDAPL